jgi:hypothetical protein
VCFIAGFPSMTKGGIVGIIIIDVIGLMMSLMSYCDITIHTTFSRFIYICRFTSILKRGAYEKVKSELVVSNPWVWGIFPWY